MLRLQEDPRRGGQAQLRDLPHDAKTPQPSGLKIPTGFNEAVHFDEAEAILSDGSSLIVRVMIDEASSLRGFVASCASRPMGAREAKRCFSTGWAAWA